MGKSSVAWDDSRHSQPQANPKGECVTGSPFTVHEQFEAVQNCLLSNSAQLQPQDAPSGIVIAYPIAEHAQFSGKHVFVDVAQLEFSAVQFCTK
jgi:hypothetical protein